MGSMRPDAGVAQLVEHELPKLGVAGSNPVARSIAPPRCLSGKLLHIAFILGLNICFEQAIPLRTDTPDLAGRALKRPIVDLSQGLNLVT